MPKSITEFFEGWKERENKEQEFLKKLQIDVFLEVDKLAKILFYQYGAKQVFLYGSFVDGTFSLHSDIDLGVLGIKQIKENYFDILKKLETQTSFHVDLVPLEDCTESFREYVMKWGREVSPNAKRFTN
ncbi:MAG: nucleotidyltransferase domain-containing protein [Halanaerobiales bacterium]|nr:nucleotidyltransferase domain-containing protein [Halanaerobiales bacterium]